MYYIDPHEIISSLVTPLMDTSKRAREYIVEISLNDAPVPVVRRLSVPSNLYVGHFVYELVYAMGWDGYHLTELTQGDTLWRSTKEKAMDAESGLEYEDRDIRFGDIGVEILSGEGACPPEDCGGVSGYEEILRIIKDPEEYEYERFRSLLGLHFDPAFFDIRSARRRLYDYERTISEVLHGFYER